MATHIFDMWNPNNTFTCGHGDGKDNTNVVGSNLATIVDWPPIYLSGYGLVVRKQRMKDIC